MRQLRGWGVNPRALILKLTRISFLSVDDLIDLYVKTEVENRRVVFCQRKNTRQKGLVYLELAVETG